MQVLRGGKGSIKAATLEPKGRIKREKGLHAKRAGLRSSFPCLPVLRVSVGGGEGENNSFSAGRRGPRDKCSIAWEEVFLHCRDIFHSADRKENFAPPNRKET